MNEMEMSSDPNEKILPSLLDEVLNGSQTIDSVLVRERELADQLKPQLEAALWIQQRQEKFDPRSGYMTASRRRLVQRVRAENQPYRGKKVRSSRREKGFFQFALAVVLMFVLLFNSGGLTAAAQSAYPGDALYPMKIAQEKMQLVVSLTDSEDVRLLIQFAQRRAEEMETLVLEGRYAEVSQTARAYQGQVSRAITLLNEMQGSDKDQVGALSTHLLSELSQNARVLRLLVQTVPDPNKPELELAIRASETAVVEPPEASLVETATPEASSEQSQPNTNPTKTQEPQ